MDRAWGVNKGCLQVQTVLLVMQWWCRMRVAVKWHVSVVSGASWRGGTCPGGSVAQLGACSFVLELWSMYQRGPEQGLWPSSMETSLVTWHAM